MSITAHILRKEKEDGPETLTEILLNFVELPCSHSGENMARTVAKILEEYNLQGKVSYILNVDILAISYAP